MKLAKQILLPKSIASKLPKLYSQEKLGTNAVVHVKFFCPWNNWTWYMTEYDPEEFIGFGLVVGQETELGYFSVQEIEGIRNRFGMYIERDMYFKPCTLAEARAKHP